MQTARLACNSSLLLRYSCVNSTIVPRLSNLCKPQQSTDMGDSRNLPSDARDSFVQDISASGLNEFFPVCAPVNPTCVSTWGCQRAPRPTLRLFVDRSPPAYCGTPSTYGSGLFTEDKKGMCRIPSHGVKNGGGIAQVKHDTAICQTPSARQRGYSLLCPFRPPAL
jgi:hypothetical protein